MSRRLDALFAERVLGRSCGWQRHIPHDMGRWHLFGEYASEPFDGVPMRDDFTPDPYESHQSPAMRGVEWDCEPLPHYTTDLSAAWEGVERVGIYLELRFRPDRLPAYETMTGQLSSADSPALAVVLACLRAVGVSEEEIQKAASDDLGGIAAAQSPEGPGV